MPKSLSIGAYYIKGNNAVPSQEKPDYAVDYEEFNSKYNERDAAARKKMRELVDSDANKVTKVLSTLC